MSRRLVLNRGVLAELVAHARETSPEECVGLLLGEGERIRESVRLRNSADEPKTSFFAEPSQLVTALYESEARGLALLAVYHSHPTGPQFLSERDVEETRYDVPQVVVVPKTAVVRAFDAAGGEVDLIVERS